MENKKEYRNWLNQMNLDHPLVIAGPCSAETEEQVLKIANQLKESDVTAYRAGIWKPRTRPGMFEGVGAIGLKWLQRVKEETGLMIATEVASPFIVPLRLAGFLALLVSIPFFLYQALAFMAPGLYKNEKGIIFSRTILGTFAVFFRVTFL